MYFTGPELGWISMAGILQFILMQLREVQKDGRTFMI
jgi:hypothetical protein